MYHGATVGVVVPAYNEEGFVGEVIRTVPSFVDRVYAVDDRSTDDTWDEIKAAAAEENERELESEGIATSGGEVLFDRRIVPIRHEQNRGVGGTIKTGYRHALRDDVDVVAVMNGDGQMDPDILDRIIDPVVNGDADYAKGNRLLYPEYREGMGAWRFFGNTVLTFLTKVASGYWKMLDPQNGYTAISKEALESLDLDGIYDRYGFCNDVLVRLNADDRRIADVAMPAVYGDEQSSIRYSTFIPTVSTLLLTRFLWRLKVKYLVFDFHPLVFLYLLGALGGLAGVVAGGYAALAGGGVVAGGFASLFLLLGATLAVGAMIADLRANADREVQVYD